MCVGDLDLLQSHLLHWAIRAMRLLEQGSCGVSDKLVLAEHLHLKKSALVIGEGMSLKNLTQENDGIRCVKVSRREHGIRQEYWANPFLSENRYQPLRECAPPTCREQHRYYCRRDGWVSTAWVWLTV